MPPPARSSTWLALGAAAAVGVACYFAHRSWKRQRFRAWLAAKIAQDVSSAGLAPRTIVLKSSGEPAYVLERGNRSASYALVVCVGFGMNAINIANLLSLTDGLRTPADTRVVVVENYGQLMDAERVRAHAREGRPFPRRNFWAQLSRLHELLTDGLGLCRIDMIGYSMGGSLAYYLKAEHPELVDQTVLLSPSLYPVISSGFLSAWARNPKLMHAWETKAEVDHFFHTYLIPHAGESFPPDLLQALVDFRTTDFPPNHIAAMFNATMEAGPLDTPERQRMQEAKVDHDQLAARLVVWASEDKVCDIRLARSFFERSPATTLRVIERCGHGFDATLTPFHLRALNEINQYLYGS
jgi:pimeloyl-ACP methyl ester carboxylesterase